MDPTTCTCLKDKDVGVYVYISTDSVYEVSEAKPTPRRSVESDAVRPTDLKVQARLKSADRYGDAKLAGEEALRNHRESGGFPWVALRFCDVIGPRDTTYRWFLYQYWLKFYHDLKLPIAVPDAVKNVKSSLTYVKGGDSQDRIHVVGNQ